MMRRNLAERSSGSLFMAALAVHCFAGVLLLPLAFAQDDVESAEDDVELPLPELMFEQEEEELAQEYLVNKPSGYLKLPSWEEEQRMAIDLGQPLHLGGGLWPGQESLIPKIRRSFQPKPAGASGFRLPEDPRMILPDAKRVSAEEIPEAYLPYYFDERPKRFLTDVQRLLSDSEWQDTDWFLTYHSNECSYKANVLLFSPEEQIPDSISGAELLSRWFPEHDHVLVFYFHGRPERVQVFFPDSLAKHFSESDFQQNLMEAVDSASKAEAPGTQLDEFCQKLGTWLLWWEKRLLTMGNQTLRGVDDEEEPLVGELPDESVAATGSNLEGGKDSTTGYGTIFWGVAGLIVSLLIGLVAWTLVAAFKGRKRPTMFPQRTPISRLGAPHSGGGSVVLTFGSKQS